MSKKHRDEDDGQIRGMISEQIPGAKIVKFFNTGSTAWVYHVQLPFGLDNELKVDRIIKVFRRDSQLPQDLGDQVFRNEISKLISVTHDNVMSVYSAGRLEISGQAELPYFVMEFIPGALDLDEWIRKNAKSLVREKIIQLLLQAARGIDALHMKGIIHCDLKFGNMLVGKSGPLKIADLGFAKYCSSKGGTTGLYTSHKYFPTCYREFEMSLADKRQMVVALPRKYMKASFDLHYFGRLIKEMLSDSKIGGLLSVSDMKSLMLMSNRLDLDSRAASLPKYQGAKQVISDLEKMQGLYLNRAGVEELSTYTGTRTLRIPVSGSIPFTDRVAEMIHHPMFFRLNNTLQLGFTNYVFPGASHTRLEHSQGVYANVSKYIGSMLADDHQPYFRQLVDEEMIGTALLAGLIHDVGQNSFAHSLEDVHITEKHETVAECFITGEGMDKYMKPDSNQEPLKTLIAKSWPEVNMSRLCWLITGERRPTQTTGLGWDIIHAILRGPIDADKTDYLLRDAHHAGVEYARSIDITRLMNSLSASLLKDHQYTKGVLAITWKGKQSAENILLARTQMFWVLYWHHAVRSAHSMLAHACASHLETLSTDEKLHFNQVLYWGTPGEFLEYLRSSRSPRAKELADWLRIRRLFKRLISLDYEHESELYESLLKKNETCKASGDKILLAMSRDIAKETNAALKGRGAAKLSEADIIVDIPAADKDKLGQIYVVEKGADVAIPYSSQDLVGSSNNWHNRVRTIRVFVDPKLDPSFREKIAREGRDLLQKVC